MGAVDVHRWAAPLCTALTATDTNEQAEALELLTREPAPILEAVLREHTVMQSHVPLATKLAALPPLAHEEAAHSCFGRSVAASACVLPLADVPTCDAILRALSAVPLVTCIELIVPPDCVVPAHALAEPIDTLAPLLRALPQLRTLQVRAERGSASAGAAAEALVRHLSGLTQLTPCGTGG